MATFLQKGESIKELLAVLSFGGDVADLIKSLFAPVCMYDSVQKLMQDLQNPSNSALRARFNQLIAEPTNAVLFRGLTNAPQGAVVSKSCVGGNTVVQVARGDGQFDTYTLIEGVC